MHINATAGQWWCKLILWTGFSLYVRSQRRASRLRAENLALLTAHEAELSNMQAEHDNIMKKLMRENKAKLDSLGASRKAKLSKWAAMSRAHLASLNARHKFKMDKLKSSHLAVIQTLNGTITHTARLEQKRLQDSLRNTADFRANARAKAVQQVQRYTTVQKRCSAASRQAAAWCLISNFLSCRLCTLGDDAPAMAETQVTTPSHTAVVTSCRLAARVSGLQHRVSRHKASCQSSCKVPDVGEPRNIVAQQHCMQLYECRPTPMTSSSMLQPSLGTGRSACAAGLLSCYSPLALSALVRTLFAFNVCKSTGPDDCRGYTVASPVCVHCRLSIMCLCLQRKLETSMCKRRQLPQPLSLARPPTAQSAVIVQEPTTA